MQDGPRRAGVGGAGPRRGGGRAGRGRAAAGRRRMRRLDRMREDLVVAVDLHPEMPAGEVRLPAVEQVEKQRQRLLLHVAARLEITAEAIELEGAVAGAETDSQAADRKGVGAAKSVIGRVAPGGTSQIKKKQ